MTRSWKENWSLCRVPRPDREGGVKKPSRAKPRTCATVNPNSLATSRDVYPFIPYWLLAPGTSHLALGDRSRFRCLALDPFRRLALARRPFRLEARLERCHQVDDLRLRRLGRLLSDLLALDLALNLLEHPFAYVVLVLVGFESFRRRLLHQLHGELQLRFLDLDLRDRHVGDRADFVGVAQLLHDEPVRLGTHRDEVLLAARRVLPHRHALRLLEGLRQQPIGAVPALVGAEEVRFLDDLPVHLLLGHELRDLDRVGGLLFERLQLLRLEDHVLPLRELVALHHLVLFDLVAVLGADVLLLQTRAVLLVQPVEADRGRRLAGGEHLDRHGNEAEGQGGGTKRVCAHGLRFHPNACKTEARARSPQYLPRQAVPGPHAGAARGSRGGDEKGEAVVRAAGLQAQGQVDPREAQEGREGVAAHQGEGRLRVGGQRAAAGVGAIRTHGRGAQGGEGPGGAGFEGARASQGAAPRRDGRRGGADARRDA